MEPFNIQIEEDNKEVTLTILPEHDYYKIIYFGGIIGAIKELHGQWELLEEVEIEPGSLPFYDYKHGVDEQPKLELNLPLVKKISGQIENVIH